MKHVKPHVKNHDPVRIHGADTPAEVLPVLTVIGVGLLGGSVALSLRAHGLVHRIIGVGRRTESLERACELGVIDEYTLDLDKAIEPADLVIVATPADAACSIVRRLGGRVKPGAVATDVASTKAAVVQAAAESWPVPVRFVGSHPIAGSHKKGAEYARADLFEGTRTVLTPDDRTDPDALAVVDRLWRSLGAQTLTLAPREHDAVLAMTSHLPHLAAAGLMLAAEDVMAENTPCVGPGFADTTRVAQGDPEMWRDICLTNREHIIDALERFENSVNLMRDAVERGDGDELSRIFERAQRLRGNIKGNDDTS